jgi:hypothetical protein
MPLDGGLAHDITHFPADTQRRPISEFEWSRDGKKLAIARTITTNDIVLLRLRP